MTPAAVDRLLERVAAGEALSPEDIDALASQHDILALGMLADAARRRLHGTQVTYLRVASYSCDDAFDGTVPAAAREVRLTAAPAAIDAATAAVRRAKAVAGDREVAGFAWADLQRWAEAEHADPAQVAGLLRDAGLGALAELPLDSTPDLPAAVEALVQAGFRQLRLTFDAAPPEERVPLLLKAAALQEQFAAIQSINPLPLRTSESRPATGYEDVRAVAIARLAAPNVPAIQVDWLRYGPKLAQVALTFGADDLDNVVPHDEAPDGRRRAPIEDVRRNIESAGFTAAERNGRWIVWETQKVKSEK